MTPTNPPTQTRVLAIWTLKDLNKAAKAHQAKMKRVFRYSKRQNQLTINYRAATDPKAAKGCGYPVDLGRIPDFEALVHWIDHLSGKGWMTRELVHEFIRQVCTIKKWNIHRRNL